MLARLIVFAAVMAPLWAQDSEVTKYLDELRAKMPQPRDLKAERRALLASVTKELESSTDPAQKANLYLRISGIQQSLGDREAAIAAARGARELEPADENVLVDLAAALVAGKQFAEAATLLGVDPTDGPALLRRAQELADVQPHRALARFCARLARDLSPGDGSVTDALGSIYMRTGSPDRAFLAFGQATAQAPQVSTYHLHYAVASLQIGRQDDARDELRAALECNPPGDERAKIEALLAKLPGPK